VDYPLGTNFDEVIKVNAVLKGAWLYRHPPLMLDIVRAINTLVGLSDPQSVAILGRSLASLFTGLLIIATWHLGRKILPNGVAVAAAIASAILPLTVVHAITFKEDAFVAPWIVLGIAALIGLIDRPMTVRAVLLGLCIGLAASAKLVGALLFPFSIVVLLLVRPGGAHCVRLIAVVVIVSVLVCALVQLLGFHDWRQLIGGFQAEWAHAMEGHGLVLPITLTGGIFYLRDTLWPGLGPALLALGAAGLIVPLLAPKAERLPCAIIVAFIVVWYLAHEISPMRPYPGFHRYMLPIGPLIVLVGGAFVYYAALHCKLRRPAVIGASAIVIAAFPALLSSIQIVSGFEHDPRRVVAAAVEKAGHPRTKFELYASYQMPEATAGDAGLLVTSKMLYGRFLRYGMRADQPAEVRSQTMRYAELFRHPYLEVAGDGRNFSYFNPTIRIIALDRDVEYLRSIAASLQVAMPQLTVRAVNY
jgi:hypothetical protein